MENKISELRQKMGISRRKLGLETNIPEATLRRYEANTTEPKLDAWSRLADFFGVSVEYLQGKKTKEEQTGWIKLKTRPATRDENILFGWPDNSDHEMFDCKIPEIGETILVTDGDVIWTDTWVNFGLSDYGFDNNNEELTDLWWAPIPDLPKTEGK